MAKDFRGLWAPVSREEKARIKKEADEFLESKLQGLEDAPPSFDDAKYTLAGIENLDDRRAKLEEIIARYEIALADIYQQKEKYEHEYTDLIESGSLDDDRRRVESGINQIHRELEFFQTKLEHNDLDFKPLKKRTNLKKLYYPFDKHGAALYTGMSVSAIEKHPREWGADMSSTPYGYTPEILDRILVEKKMVSPYWDYPELVVPAPTKPGVTDAEVRTSGPRKIFWKGLNPDKELVKLIEYWEDQDYIDVDTNDGEYVSQRFTTDSADKTVGKTILWNGKQPDLLAYLELLTSEKFLPDLSKPNQFIREHFIWRGGDGNIREWDPESLNSERSRIRRYFANKENHNIDSQTLLERLTRIETAIVELKLI